MRTPAGDHTLPETTSLGRKENPIDRMGFAVLITVLSRFRMPGPFTLRTLNTDPQLFGHDKESGRKEKGRMRPCNITPPPAPPNQ